jgi:opacity protein-like surface antigen
MRKYVLAASAVAAFATPAYAAADGPYVGIEGGATFPNSTDLDVVVNHGVTTTTYDNGFNAKYKTGYDVDAILGYKFGLFRLEGEAGYKRAKVKSLGVSTPLITDVGTAAGLATTADDFSVGNHIGIKSLMANALIDGDFGGGFGGYAGGGAGRAWANFAGDNDNAWAIQGIAGVRYALSSHVDAGLKYRYFHTGKLGFDDAFTLNAVPFTTSTKGNYDSHSLLASLIYNFNSRGEAAPIPAAAPAPPPLPPPEAPATQTCPDGSVIMATSACPAPPPPPPPPVERGERGR